MGTDQTDAVGYRYPHSPGNLLTRSDLLVTGDAEFEFYAHEILARAAGLGEEIIDSIRRELHPAVPLRAID